MEIGVGLGVVLHDAGIRVGGRLLGGVPPEQLGGLLGGVSSEQLGGLLGGVPPEQLGGLLGGVPSEQLGGTPLAAVARGIVKVHDVGVGAHGDISLG
jgi:hypothetical protein